tara:strand:+ start:164 stop:724 length:561 start_codon:yes stop_codon:yes gene_type:complete
MHTSYCKIIFLLTLICTVSVNAQRRANYSSVRVLEQEISRMARKVDSLQDTVASYSSKINEMKKEVKTLREENRQLRLQLSSMQRAIEAESNARKKSVEKVISTVAGQVSSVAASTHPAPAPAAPSKRSSSEPVGSGEFYKHKVQAGSNLTIIAQAYKVKVSDIMKANKMKNDRIFAGQVLYIPKK